MTDELAESESKGYADGYAGRIRQRSDDPDEKRWLFYYEPDDEQWNAYQYGQGTGNHKRLIEEAIAKACVNATGGQLLGYTKPPVKNPERY